MKKGFFLLIFMGAVLLLPAQVKTPAFAYGISSDFLSVPFNDKSLLARSTNVYVSYCANKDLSFSLGYDGLLLQNAESKTYDDLSGIMLGGAYTIFRDKAGVFSNEVSLSLSNGLKDFISFKNYHVDLGTRFMLFDAFYLGAGVRWSHNEKTTLSMNPVNSLGLYMQLGIRFFLGKKQ